jgi:hypothetical protein
LVIDLPITVAWFSCSDSAHCKLKIHDGSGTCYGTVLVPCGGEIKFYCGADGSPDYAVTSGSDDNGFRDLLEESEEGTTDKEGAVSSLQVVRSGSSTIDTAFSSSTKGEGVEDGTTGGLRGATGSRRTV